MADSKLEGLFETIKGELSTDEERQGLQAVKNGNDQWTVPSELLQEEGGLPNENIAALIKELSVPQKIKLALFGNRLARALLIRDTNRQIPLFVLQNGRVTDDEILEFANNTNLDASIFREIAENRSWMRSYALKVALVGNPKVPVGASLRLINYLQDKDLRRFGKSKNISQVIATECRKILERRGH